MRGEQNNILFPVRISWAYHFPNLSPFAPPLGLEPLQATAPKLAAQNHLKFEKSCYEQLFLYWHGQQRKRQNDKNKRKKRENTRCLIGWLGGEMQK